MYSLKKDYPNQRTPIDSKSEHGFNESRLITNGRDLSVPGPGYYDNNFSLTNQKIKPNAVFKSSTRRTVNKTVSSFSHDKSSTSVDTYPTYK